MSYSSDSSSKKSISRNSSSPKYSVGSWFSLKKEGSASMIISSGVVPPSSVSMTVKPWKISVSSLKALINWFSAVNWVIPIALIAAIKTNTTIVSFCLDNTRFDNVLVILEVKSFSCLVCNCLRSIKSDGKRRKTMTKIAPILINIIQPKSITGRMPAMSREANPTMVVIVVYKQGTHLFFNVWWTNHFWDFSGCRVFNSR